MWKKDEKLHEKNRQKHSRHCIDNPFGCDLHEVWEKVKQKSEELNLKCYPNTYVWIEKFKDDNF